MNLIKGGKEEEKKLCMIPVFQIYVYAAILSRNEIQMSFLRRLHRPKETADRPSGMRAHDGLRKQFRHRDDHHFGNLLFRRYIDGVGDDQL